MKEIVSAEFVGAPQLKPGLFAGRPYTVYFARAVRSDGKTVKCGMRSFETEQEAAAWAQLIDPTAGEIPF